MDYKCFVTPNDDGIMSDSDSKSIQNAIDFAKKSNISTVVIPKLCKRTNSLRWIIDKSILLPSDITIILDSCHLTLADGVYENIFRNENVQNFTGSKSSEKWKITPGCSEEKQEKSRFANTFIPMAGTVRKPNGKAFENHREIRQIVA